MKLCNKCGVEKSLDNFSRRTYSSGNIGYQNKCKVCEKEDKKARYKPHQDIRRRLKISDGLFENLMKTTNCQTCGVELTRKCIDHDHKTNKVRGVLCHNCNTALGLVGDNIDTLSSMITYLNDHIRNTIQTGRDHS